MKRIKKIAPAIAIPERLKACEIHKPKQYDYITGLSQSHYILRKELISCG